MRAGPRAAAVAALFGAFAGALLGTFAAPVRAEPPKDLVARLRRALEQDAQDLRRLAEAADRAGLERTADLEWERVLAADPADEAARRRLRYVRRGGEWVRDDASWAIVTSAPETHPEHAAAHAQRRRGEFERPASMRRRDLAIALRAAGEDALADEQLRLAAAADPGDAWSRLALGFVPDPDDGWVTPAVRERRVADARARAHVAVLESMRAEPIALETPSPRSAAAGTPLRTWSLREWRLETDLPDAEAAIALEAADLGARWFRDLVGLPPGTPVLPGVATFVVCSTPEVYRRVVDATPGLSSTERAFAARLSAFPIPHPADRGPWEVVVERGDGVNAADVCLHYAVHFLAQARFHVEAQEAWLYEGLAAYAAARLLEFHGTWCVRLEPTSARPGMPEVPDDPGEWPETVEWIVRTRDDFPLEALVGVSMNGLDGPMLAKSWSLLRWLVEEHPERARAFLEAKRAGTPTPRALTEATGLSLHDLDEAWRDTVLAQGE